MPNSVTNRQMVFILLLTITTFTVVTISKTMAETSGRGSWIPILIGAVIFAIGTAIIMRLQSRFEGKMIFDYSKILVGKAGAYILSAFYVIYFSGIVVYLVTQLAIILKHDFLHKTPPWITMALGIPVFCYIAYKGITNLARLMEFIGIIFIFVAFFVHILMVTQSDWSNILPLYNPADSGDYLRAIEHTIVPYLGMEVLLIIPFSKQNGKRAVRVGFITLIVLGLFYTLVVESCIMKLGLHEIVHYKDPLIIAIRNMEIPLLDFFQRMDFLYLTIGFMGFFMGITVVYTAILEHLCKMFPKAKRAIVATIVGAVSFFPCTFFVNKNGYRVFIESIGQYFGLIAVFAIPILLLLITKVKKHV